MFTDSANLEDIERAISAKTGQIVYQMELFTTPLPNRVTVRVPKLGLAPQNLTQQAASSLNRNQCAR